MRKRIIRVICLVNLDIILFTEKLMIIDDEKDL